MSSKRLSQRELEELPRALRDLGIAEDQIEAPRMLRIEEIAERLGVSVRRVRSIPAGELPYAQLDTRGVRLYLAADLDRYLERRTIRS